MVENTDMPDVWQCPPTQENGRSGGQAPKSSPVQCKVTFQFSSHMLEEYMLDLVPRAMTS